MQASLRSLRKLGCGASVSKDEAAADRHGPRASKRALRALLSMRMKDGGCFATADRNVTLREIAPPHPEGERSERLEG